MNLIFLAYNIVYWLPMILGFTKVIDYNAAFIWFFTTLIVRGIANAVRNNMLMPDKGEYFKYCGQKFWEFISGDKELYLSLIKPLGHKAKEKNEEFYEEYAKIMNKFTIEFSEKFCSDGKIDWDSLVKFNSSKVIPVITFVASLAKGIPIALLTNGIVRDARGLTSRI